MGAGPAESKMTAISKPNLVAMIVACAFFMQSLDSTIVATALPQIAISFGVNPIQLSITIIAYVLALAVCIPISGWLADRYGARTVFCAAIGSFTLASVLCAFSNNITSLTLARILQGAGAAMIVPVGRFVVLRTAKKSEFVRALAFLSVPAQIGPILGPPVGGLITTYASWRWIFLINVPIGVLGIALAVMYIENYREAERRPLDWVGFLVTGVALSLTMYGLEAISRDTASRVEVAAFLCLGILAGIASVWHGKRHPYPLIDLALLRIPSFRVNFCGGTIARVGWGCLPYLLPLLFQVVFHMTAFESGLLTFASAVGALSMRASAPRIFRWFGFRWILVRSAVASTVGLIACAFFTDSTPVVLLVVPLLVIGFFWALQAAGLNSLAYSDLAPEQMSGATGFAQLMQQLGNAMGVAVASIVLHLALAWSGTDKLTVFDFHVAFAAVAIIALGCLPFYMGLRPDAGAHVSGHRPK